MGAIAGLDTVSRELALKGLEHMYPASKKSDYHEDFATILCFLSDRAAFDAAFGRMSADLESMYRFRKGTLHVHNRLTAAFVDLFNILHRASGGKLGCDGFKNGHESRVVLSNKEAQNVTLTGNALHLFGGIVKAGYLFKDGTGPSHGEYAHSLQWLTIAYAAYFERIKLTHKLIELYTNTVAPPFSKVELSTLHPDTDVLIKVGLPYWSQLVDCFRTGELNGLAEDYGSNLFVENYRSPNYLTDQMLYRRLSGTFVGKHLQERYAKRKQLGYRTGAHQRETVRTWTYLNQFVKDAVLLEGATTNATHPSESELSSDLAGRTTKNSGTRYPRLK